MIMSRAELPEAEEVELKTRFTFHPPKGFQAQTYEAMRARFLSVAVAVSLDCPPSRELSLALTHLEQANFYANAAIARRE